MNAAMLNRITITEDIHFGNDAEMTAVLADVPQEDERNIGMTIPVADGKCPRTKQYVWKFGDGMEALVDHVCSMRPRLQTIRLDMEAVESTSDKLRLISYTADHILARGGAENAVFIVSRGESGNLMKILDTLTDVGPF